MFNSDQHLKGSFKRRLNFAQLLDSLESFPHCDEIVKQLEDFREVRKDEDWRFVRHTCPMKSGLSDCGFVSHLDQYYLKHKPEEWRKTYQDESSMLTFLETDSEDRTPNNLALFPNRFTNEHAKLSDLISDVPRIRSIAEKILWRVERLIEEAIRAALDRTFREAVIREARIPHGMTIPTATDLAEVAWIAAKSRRKNSGKLAGDHIDEKQILELEAVTELVYGLCLLRGKEKSGVAVKHIRDALRTFDRVPSFALEKERALIQARRAADDGDISKATRIAEEYALDRTAGRTSKLTAETQSLLSELAIPEAVVAEGLEMTIGLPYVQRSQLTDAAVDIFESGLLESEAEYDLYRWATVEKANCLRIATEYGEALRIAEGIDMETPFRNEEIRGDVYWRIGGVRSEAGDKNGSMEDFRRAIEIFEGVDNKKKVLGATQSHAALLTNCGDQEAFYLYLALIEQLQDAFPDDLTMRHPAMINASISRFYLEIAEPAPYRSEELMHLGNSRTQCWITYLAGLEAFENSPDESFKMFNKAKRQFLATMQLTPAGLATLQAAIAAYKDGSPTHAAKYSKEAASFFQTNNVFGGRLASAAETFQKKAATALSYDILHVFKKVIQMPYLALR